MSTEVRPRIAVLASFSGPGGVEHMLVNLMRGFVEQGVAVDALLIRQDSVHLQRLPAEVRAIPLGGRHSISALPGLVRYLRQERPRHLLAAKDRAGRLAIVARALSRVPCVLGLRLGTHLGAAMAERSNLERALRYGPIRLLYPQLEHIIAVSRGVADNTARIAGLPAERIQVVRNPVITPDLLDRAAAPVNHPWFDGTIPVILGAGRFTEQKDFPTLLRAFALLRQTHPARLVVLGEGRGRAALAQLAQEQGITEDLDLPGFQANPYPWLRQARLFALSSRWEGSPNVLTEALALGTPVVSTDCPSGPAEILQDGRIAPLVPMGQPAALADAMRQVLQAPPDPASLRAAVADYHQALSARRYLHIMGILPEIEPPAHAAIHTS